MYTVAKKFKFCAAHHHTKLPDGHPCRRVHGHNWEVEIGFELPELNEHDFVIDYGAIRIVVKPTIDALDHQDLNEVFDFNPSCENIARHLFHKWAAEFQEQYNLCPSWVRVSEAEGTFAEFRP